MPKELYFKIDEEKRDRIYQAAFQEFSNNKFNEASINQIVKNSDISRGSFYQYFEDKQDIYFYILDTILEKETYSYIEDLLQMENNVFDIFKKLLKFNLDLISTSKYSDFFEKLYLSLDYEISHHLNKKINQIKAEMLQYKSENIFKKTVYKNKQHIRELINLLQMINKDLICRKVFENIDDKNIMRVYDIRIEILKQNNEVRYM